MMFLSKGDKSKIIEYWFRMASLFYIQDVSNKIIEFVGQEPLYETKQTNKTRQTTDSIKYKLAIAAGVLGIVGSFILIGCVACLMGGGIKISYYTFDGELTKKQCLLTDVFETSCKKKSSGCRSACPYYDGILFNYTAIVLQPQTLCGNGTVLTWHEWEADELQECLSNDDYKKSKGMMLDCYVTENCSEFLFYNYSDELEKGSKHVKAGWILGVIGGGCILVCCTIITCGGCPDD